MLGAFWEAFWVSKKRKSVLKLSLKSSSASERHFGPLGIVLGSIWGSYWGRLGLCFAVRWPNTKTLIFDDPLTRNRVFSGPRGSQNPSKIAPDGLLALSLAPKTSWRPLGIDLEVFWGSFWDPQGPEKNTISLERVVKNQGFRVWPADCKTEPQTTPK